MGMGQDNEVGGEVGRLDRRSWIVVKERIDEDDMAGIGGDLK
jgi:hypothetical protein